MDGGGRGRYGYYGGGGRHHRNRRGGRGGRYRHQPYHNRHRGPRQGRGSNRFGGGQTHQDPQMVLFRQVASFVSRVGELKNIRDSESAEMRAAVATAASNVNDLTAVLCAEDKLDMLLRFKSQPASAPAPAPASSEVNGGGMDGEGKAKPEDLAGKLVHLVISCTAALPLQTPCYAALTLAVHERVKGTQFEGFADRAVQYAMLYIAHSLDTVLLLGTEKALPTCHLKLLLRYLASLAKIGVVKPYEGEETPNPNKMTFFGLLLLFVEMANASAEQHNNICAASVFALLVLSTLPYIMDLVPHDVISQKLVQPLETLLENYKSTFQPGIGLCAILLKDELAEDDEADDDEEEEDGDDDEDESAGQTCDTLQDLLRICKRMTKDSTSRFCLPSDAPWKGLVSQQPANAEGAESEPQTITFADDPFYLDFRGDSQAVQLLVGEDSPHQLQIVNLEGIVFGRLPIFGSPSDPDEDGEDEDDEDMEDEVKNENLEAFTKGYGLLDRYFVSDILRDCFICHESHVNSSGLEQGGAKAVAEELLSVCHVFSGENPQAGLEYAILETLFALLVQTTETSTLRRTLLSRVLLELTRIQPSKFSAALTVAMSNVFQYYLPSLVPASRDCVSQWFSYHLTNTDYQWPGAFWSLWEPYVANSKPSSRRSFIEHTLNLLVENVSDPATIAEQCLSSSKALIGALISDSTKPTPEGEPHGTIVALEAEIQRRIWDSDEDPSLLSEFLVGDETVNSLDEVKNVPWSKTKALISIVVDPARKLLESMKTSLEGSGSEESMETDTGGTKDTLVTITDCIARYKDTIQGILRIEAQNIPDGVTSDPLVLGEAVLLRCIQGRISFSSHLLRAVISCLIQHRLVSAEGVIHWSLGDVGDDSVKVVVPRWWEYAIDATFETLALQSRDGFDSIAFVVEGQKNSREEQVFTRLVEQSNRLLSYAVQRVCQLLSRSEGDEKRLTFEQVEEIEGLKTFTNMILNFLRSFFAAPKASQEGVTPGQAEAILKKVGLRGPALANLCNDHESSNPVKTLKRSLEYL